MPRTYLVSPAQARSPHGWVQILALFRDYDMRWPHSTLKFLSWSEIFNVGFTVTAPSVRLQHRAPMTISQRNTVAAVIMFHSVCIFLLMLAVMPSNDHITYNPLSGRALGLTHRSRVRAVLHPALRLLPALRRHPGPAHGAARPVRRPEPRRDVARGPHRPSPQRRLAPAVAPAAPQDLVARLGNRLAHEARLYDLLCFRCSFADSHARCLLVETVYREA